MSVNVCACCGSTLGIMAEMLTCDLEVREFELQSRHNFHF